MRTCSYLFPGAVFVVGLAAACSTQPEPGERGKQIIQRMSDKIGSASSFSVMSDETIERTPQTGPPTKRTLARKTFLRRKPDRLYFETSGDADNQGWYDGVGMTIVLNRDKVFAQARMPETLDRALDSVHERYGIDMPLADLLYAAPASALLAATTTGGWVGQEDLDGGHYDHVKFQDQGVTWEFWIPTAGDPLPHRARIDATTRQASRHVEVTFRDWNLSPTISDDQFEPRVPPDYEGIAMLQRAAVLKNMPEGESPAPPPAKP